MNLFRGENDRYTGIPKLRREKNFPKKLPDLKTDLKTNFQGQRRTVGVNSGDQTTTLEMNSGDQASTSGVNSGDQTTTSGVNSGNQAIVSGPQDQSHLSEEVFVDLQQLLG